jgi:hypothetical protein
MATHDPDDIQGGPNAVPGSDSARPAAPGGPVPASQNPLDVANTPGAGDLPRAPTSGTPPPGDPGGAAAGGALDTGPNPVIGTFHTPHIEVPQGVIHSINAVPGEANPALQGTSAGAAGPPATTAELLAEREEAEAQWQESGAGVRTEQLEATGGVVTPYEDAEDNVLPDNMQAGGRPNFSGASEVTPLEYMESPHSYSSLIGQAGALDAVDARLDAKAEANANVIEQAESVSGVNFREPGNYEHREFEPSAPERDDVMSGAGTGMSTQDPGPILTVSALFPTMAQAQTTVRQLLEIGVAPEDIALLARHDEGDSSAAATPAVTPAGEEAVRRASDELPNDEDLPTTVADMTEAPADEMAGTPRAGLSRDEGTIPRVEAPADPDIYSDFAPSDADYRTTAAEGAAQAGEPAAADVPVTHVTARSGAVVGGLAGLVTGLAALAIPGVGPFIAAGPIAGALIGLVAGTIGGGLLGALLEAGVPEEQARAFAGRVEAGSVLLTVRTDRFTRPAVRNILAANGAEDLQS